MIIRRRGRRTRLVRRLCLRTRGVLDCAGHYFAVDSVGLPREYRLGVWLVDTITLALDLKHLLYACVRTCVCVFLRESLQG